MIGQSEVIPSFRYELAHARHVYIYIKSFEWPLGGLAASGASVDILEATLSTGRRHIELKSNSHQNFIELTSNHIGLTSYSISVKPPPLN